MTISKVHSALIDAYQDMDLGLPTAYETRDFTPPAGQPAAYLVTLPATLDPSTLGAAGLDLYVGIFQIDFSVPENTGTGKLLQWADAVRAYFYAGRTLHYNGQAVRVRKTEPSSIRRTEGGGRFVITLSVRWNAWLPR